MQHHGHHRVDRCYFVVGSLHSSVSFHHILPPQSGTVSHLNTGYERDAFCET